ncbi:MAG: glycosyltransferase family 39 protein [Acidobacteriota bacterium]
MLTSNKQRFWSSHRTVRFSLPALICGLFLIVITFAANRHPYGTYTTETDFYQFYAPDAERLLNGQFPENTYNGPGYPLMLAVLTKLTGEVFLSGKIISVVSATLVVLFTFLLFEKSFGFWIGIGAELLVAVGTAFPAFAITTTTDIFFLMLCLATMWVFLLERLAGRWRIILTAAIASFAYVTRYNGLFLLATVLAGVTLFNIFNNSWRERLKNTAMFIGIFLVVAAPWLYANYRHHGSPFYNTNYLNIATEFYPELANNSVYQEGTRGLSEKFHSFGEVLGYDPRRVLTHYPENLYEAMSKSINADLVHHWLGWAAILGFVIALIERRSKTVLLIVLSGVLYFLVVAFTHWEARYYFYVMVLYAGFAAYGVIRPFELLRENRLLGKLFAQPAEAAVIEERGQRPLLNGVMVLVSLILFCFIWYNAFTVSKKTLTAFLASHPTEIPAASGFIKSEGVAHPRILARKPHLAFFTRGEWIFFPTVKSLDELKTWLSENQIDYLAFGIREAQARPELKFLQDKSQAPAWLVPVWMDEARKFVLYKPQINDVSFEK